MKDIPISSRKILLRVSSTKGGNRQKTINNVPNVTMRRLIHIATARNWLEMPPTLSGMLLHNEYVVDAMLIAAEKTRIKKSYSRNHLISRFANFELAAVMLCSRLELLPVASRISTTSISSGGTIDSGGSGI